MNQQSDFWEYIQGQWNQHMKEKPVLFKSYSSLIHKNIWNRNVWPSAASWRKKMWLSSIYDGILFSHKKIKSSHLEKIDGTGHHYAKWNIPDTWINFTNFLLYMKATTHKHSNAYIITFCGHHILLGVCL